MATGPRVETLSIEGLRNIADASLDLDGRCALLTGTNGAGKTTLLEAVYLLSRGKSFRGARAGDLTTWGHGETRIRARIAADAFPADWLFVRSGRTAGRWVDGIATAEIGGGWDRFSVRLVGENAQQLLEADPSLRRRFLDWNLFHMEPGYGAALRRFRQVLEQRNAWLRQGARGRAVWDDEFLAAGEALHRLRTTGLARIAAALEGLCAPFAWLGGAELRYGPGIPAASSFSGALLADRDGERAAGFTRVGPHRADFWISIGGRRAVLSRGQQKGAVCLLQLACGSAQETTAGTMGIWLLDDLWGDLDEDSIQSLVTMFLGTGCQCLFTMIAARPAARIDLLPSNARLFHVEHGRVLPLA